jgi:hypothetical protein
VGGHPHPPTPPGRSSHRSLVKRPQVRTRAWGYVFVAPMASRGGRIDTDLGPPGRFAATAMHLAMVAPTER